MKLDISIRREETSGVTGDQEMSRFLRKQLTNYLCYVEST